MLGAATQHRLRPRAALHFPRSLPLPAHEQGKPWHCCSPTDMHGCGHGHDCVADAGSLQISLVPQGIQSRVPVGRPCTSTWEDGAGEPLAGPRAGGGQALRVSASHLPLQHC